MRQLCAAICAVTFTLNLSLPAFAQGVSYDLTSTTRSQAAPSSIGNGSVFIREGNNLVKVGSHDLLTPAQAVAASQVINTGVQKLLVGAQGNAVGGTFGIGGNFTQDISNLVIPRGVTTYNATSILNVLGNITNSGSFLMNATQNTLSSLNATNIINNLGGLISSPHSLNLVASKDIFNYGQIISGDKLGLSAGNSIVNVATSTMPGSGTISSTNNMNLVANSIINSGAISSAAGSINISSAVAHDIVINNAGGTISAGRDINVRDSAFTGKYNFAVTGGDLLSNNLNIWSGNGNADVMVNNLSGLVNVSAGNIHVVATETPVMRLGTITYQEDPTFFNLGGSIQINGAIATGQAAPAGVAIVASGDVTSSAAGSISTGGFPAIIIAGANFTLTPASAQGSATTSGLNGGAGDTTTLLTLVGPSVTGGMIDLSNLTGISTSGSSPGGGSLTLVAFAGANTAAANPSGTVNLGATAINTTSTVAAQPNGNVTIIAGAKNDPSGSSVITQGSAGSITTDSMGATAGAITMITGTPVLSGNGQFQIFNGSVIGANLELSSASLGTNNVNPGASITVGAMTTNVAPITLIAGNNVTLNGSISTNGVLPATNAGVGGNVLVLAGGSITGGITSISTKGSTTGSAGANAGGDVVLAAGVKSNAVLTHTFAGSDLQNLQSNQDTIGLNATVTGPSASGGLISLPSLATLTTMAGATQATTPTLNNASGGNVTLVAFNGAQSGSTTGQVELPAVSITTGGSALNPSGASQANTNNLNGNVTVLAGGQNITTPSAASAITLGSSSTSPTIDTSGGNEGGGNILIVNSQPTAGLPVSYLYSYVAATSSTSATPETVNGSFSPTSKLVSADITVNNNLNAVGGNFQVLGNTTATTDITVKAGNNLNIADVNNTNNTLPAGGPPGELSSSTINLSAVNTMNVGGAISSNAGTTTPNVSGASGGTINLKAGSYAFPNGQQTISANGTGGYISLSNPLNFTGTLTASNNQITNTFTTIDGAGIVIGSVVTDNAGNTLIPAGTTVSSFTPGTVVNGVLTTNANTIDGVITTGLSTGLAISGGSIPAGATIQTIPTPSPTFTGDTVSGTNTITNVSSTTGLAPGAVIAGPGIPVGATIAVGGISGNTITFDGGNATSTSSGGTFAQGETITFTGSTANVVGGPIQVAAANGTITLSQNTTPAAGGAAPLTDLLPIGQSGGNGGTVSIATTGSAAGPINVNSTGFAISAIAATNGGNGGHVNLNSGSSIAVNPASLTAAPSANPLVNSGFATVINTGTGAVFNFTAATTVLINGALNANGAPSTLSGTSGSPGGNGGVINIVMNSSTPFSVGAATTNGLTSGMLSANGNVGTNPGFGSGGTISIENKGGDISIATGLSVAAANATDTNTGTLQTTYTGGAGGQIILKGNNIISAVGLDASGGADSTLRGSGDGGSIVIKSNSTNTFTVGATSLPTNGIQGTLTANGNVSVGSPSQGTIIGTLPSGSGGTLSITNSGGGIALLSGAGMSVGAANASTQLGNIGGNGGTIILNAKTVVQSAIGLNASGGAQAALNVATPASTIINNGGDVPIPLTSTAGLFQGQTIALQDSSGAAEAVLIKSVDSATQITVWGVVAAPVGGYSNPTVQTYMPGGNGGKIEIVANATGLSGQQMTINNGSTASSFINGTLVANGYNGGFISVTHGGTLGIYVAPGAISVAPTTPSSGVGTLLIGLGGYGGNLAVQAPNGPVAIDGTQNSTAVALNGITIATSSTLVGPNFGGLGGNLTIVSNSKNAFTVNAAGPATAAGFNGVAGLISANGGAGVGGNSSAGTVTIVNLGTGGISVQANGTTNNPGISLIPGVAADGTFNSNGPPGNGGSLTLTAPNGPVFVAGSNGINVSGNVSGQHASNQADGLAGTVSITSNGGTTPFSIAAGTTNGTAGPIVANGWNGGSITVIERGTGGIVLDNTGGTNLQVTANAANDTFLGSGGIHLAGGPGGFVSLQASKGIVAITGGIDASGGAQESDGTDFLQGGNGGQISILTGKSGTTFNVGGATAGQNGTTGALTANGGNGGVINITALNGADIVVSSSSSISVSGTTGASCTGCNNGVPDGNPPTNINAPGGNGGRIYLQATGTGGNVFINGTLSVDGAGAGTGPNAGNGGLISIITNSTTGFNLGGSGAATNGVASGSSLSAQGYNGGTISVSNLGGNLYFNPSAITVATSCTGCGAVATNSLFPGGNGGVIDLQAPVGKLGSNTAGGVLKADATASTDPTDPQMTASGGTISLGAKQIDPTTIFSMSAKGAQAAGYMGKGGTVIMRQTTATASQALSFGGSNFTIVVNGSPSANLGGSIILASPAGINIGGIGIGSDAGTSGSIALSANVINQAGGSGIRTGALVLSLGAGGTGSAGLATNVQSVSAISNGPLQLVNLGDMTLTAVNGPSTKTTLSVTVAQGSLTVNAVKSTGQVLLGAAGQTSTPNSGNVIINGNVIAPNVTLTAVSGDGLTGGSIIGPGLVSANAITLSPEIGGAVLNTATGNLTIRTVGAFSILVNNTGNLLLGMSTSSDIGALTINNNGSITTRGNLNMVGGLTLNNVPGTLVNGSTTAGYAILNTSDLSSLILGAPVQGAGLAAGTTIGGVFNNTIGLTGDISSSSNIINNVTSTGFQQLAPGVSVTGTDLAAGTVITGVTQQFALGGVVITSGDNVIGGIASTQLGQLLPGVAVNSGGLPAGTVFVSTVPQFGFQGDVSTNSNTITNVPASTPNLVNGAVITGVTGIPTGAVITNVSAPVGGFVQVTFSGSSSTPTQTGATITVLPYAVVSNSATGAATSATVPNYVTVSQNPTATATSDTFTQGTYASLTQAATSTAASATVKQLATSVPGNSNSITINGTVGSGAVDPIRSVTINAGGRIIQTSGVISANAVSLSSLNGNIGVLNRTFSNNIYTPGGVPINLDIVPNGTTAGTLTAITTNAINNSSAGTINLSIGATTANPSGQFDIAGISAGGDVLITSNLTATQTVTTPTLNIAGTVSSSYGAITVLNNNTTDGVININANMSAGGGPLTIQNNNQTNATGSIVLNSSSTTPITLSGVGWYVDGLAAANQVNSLAGVALISGAFPATPSTGSNPGNITVTGSGTVFFGASGSVSSDTPNTVINVTGTGANQANVVFNGASGAITLGNSGVINATSNALVISSLNLSNSTVISNLTALQGAANSGVVGSLASKTLTFDPTQATVPLSLSNLNSFVVPTGYTLTFANFGASNPITVNTNGSNPNASIAGTVSFSAISGTQANNFNSAGHLFFNSTVTGQVLTIAGQLTSDNNLSVNAGGSVTISGKVTGGTNGTLGLFTGAANLSATTTTATTLPAGTITLTGGDLSAGQVYNSGNIIIDAVNYKASSTSSIVGNTVTMSLGGSNWVQGKLTPVQIASSSLAGIQLLVADVMNITAGSGGSITVKGQTTATSSPITQVNNLNLNIGKTALTYTQLNSMNLGGQSTDFLGSVLSGSNILNGNVSNLVSGTLVKGVGLPFGTRVSAVSTPVTFQGDTAANATVITNVPDTTPGLTIGAAISGDGIPAGSVISAISAPASGTVNVTFTTPVGTTSSTPAASGSSFTQPAYATVSNQATASVNNVTLKNFAAPASLGTLNVSIKGGSSALQTSSDVKCDTCIFQAEALTNLFNIQTIGPVGTVQITPPTGFTLAITQTDGVNSGSIFADAGISISGGNTLNIVGGSITTAAGALSVTHQGPSALTIDGATLTAGSFNGIPLGPTLVATDLLAAGNISVKATNFVVSNSGALHSIGGNLNVTSGGTTSLQGNFVADGGNVIIVSAKSLTADGSYFLANAIGSSQASSVGGSIELAAGFTKSQLTTTSYVPGELPSNPVFVQPYGGPAQPLGTNVAIDNNATGVFYPTGSIRQSLSGTGAVMNLGNSTTAQTGFNLLGGQMLFSAKSTSMLVTGSNFNTNGYSPIAAVSGRESLQFAGGDMELRGGSMFVETVDATTIHTKLADIKAKKGALFRVCEEAQGVRITVCSGPGHVTIVHGAKSINVSAGEEVLLSKHEVSVEEQGKADGIGRRNFSSHRLADGLHVGLCEVSLMTVINNWEHAQAARSKSITDRMMKTAAVLTMLTQRNGAYQSRAKAPHDDAPVYMPVKYVAPAAAEPRS